MVISLKQRKMKFNLKSNLTCNIYSGGLAVIKPFLCVGLWVHFYFISGGLRSRNYFEEKSKNKRGSLRSRKNKLIGESCVRNCPA